MPGIPEGYGRVTAYLLYADAAAAVKFLVDSFGFVEREEQMTGPDGRLVHAALTAVDQVVLVGSPGPNFKGPGAVATVHLYVYIDDVDAHCARARAAGARIVTEPEDASFGDRRYAALDSEGHHWWFAEHSPKGASTQKDKKRKLAEDT